MLNIREPTLRDGVVYLLNEALSRTIVDDIVVDRARSFARDKDAFDAMLEFLIETGVLGIDPSGRLILLNRRLAMRILAELSKKSSS